MNNLIIIKSFIHPFGPIMGQFLVRFVLGSPKQANHGAGFADQA